MDRFLFDQCQQPELHGLNIFHILTLSLILSQCFLFLLGKHVTLERVHLGIYLQFRSIYFLEAFLSILNHENSKFYSPVCNYDTTTVFC